MPDEKPEFPGWDVVALRKAAAEGVRLQERPSRDEVSKLRWEIQYHRAEATKFVDTCDHQLKMLDWIPTSD